MKGAVTPRRERKVIKEICVRRAERKCECIPVWGRLVVREDLSKERAVLGQVDKLGKVSSYCEIDCCVR